MDDQAFELLKAFMNEGRVESPLYEVATEHNQTINCGANNVFATKLSLHGHESEA